jgi:HEAT repeats
MIPSLTLLPLLIPGGGITWSPSLEQAKAQALAETKVIFVAVHMPGERANERMAKRVYTDKTITQLSERTLNLVAMAMGPYREQGSHLDLGDLTEEQLQRLDIDLRAQVLKPDAEGFVVAPQHVFLKPDGEVILSVPYEISAAELEWCFVQALTALDPEHAPKASEHARPPKRLIKAGVIQGNDASIGATPATLEEVLALIKEINKSRAGNWDKKMRLLTADEEKARGFVTKLLRGGGRGGDDTKTRLIQNIQRRSPASWWEVVIEFAEHHSPAVREQVAACLEVLAAEPSLADIKKALRKEKDPRLQGMWLRAQASAGPADSRVRKATLKAAHKSKHPITRANATLALGYLSPGEDVRALIADLLDDPDAPREVKTAAICALALTRDEDAREVLAPLAQEAGELKAAATAALKTLDEGDLAPLGPFVKGACGDQVTRERLFGAAQS